MRQFEDVLSQERRTQPAVPAEGKNSRRLQALYVVNDLLKKVVGQGLNIDHVLPEVLQAALDELQAYSGSIVIVGRQFEIQHSWLVSGRSGRKGPDLFLRRVVQEGMFGWMLNTKQPAIVSNTQTDRRWLNRPDHPTSTSPWSAIGAPLIIRSQAIGAVSMIRQGENQFNEEDVALLSAIANQAASIIESARLYEESQRRGDELSALVRATADISAHLDMDSLLATAVQKMVQFTGADGCAIYDWNPETYKVTRSALHLAKDINPEKLDSRKSFRLQHYPLTQEILQERFAVQLHVDDRWASHSEHHYMDQAGIHRLLLAPMVVGEHAVGLAEVFQLGNAPPFTNSQINLLQTLVNHTAVSLENARMYARAQHQLRVTALLNEASRVINASLNMDEILGLLLSHMNELLNADAISIALIDQETGELVYEVAEGPGREKIIGMRLPADYGVAGWVVQNGVPAHVPNTMTDPRFNRGVDQQTGYNTQAIICAPLMAQNEVLGSVQAINPKTGRFTEDDMQLLVNLANLASSALANARQFQRTQAAEARYLGLFEDSVNPILLSDDDGTIVEANRRAHDFLGYERGELLGRKVSDLHSTPEVQTALALVQINSSDVRVFSSEVRTKAGKQVPVEVYAKRTAFQGNRLLQWIYRDITQQVELNEMREDLTAMLVHDLQSPLGNVISSLELLHFELPEDADGAVYSILDIAIRSSRRLQTLIRSLLDINHLEAGHPLQEADYAPLLPMINEAVETVRPTLERRGVQVEVKVRPDEPVVYGDKDMLQRVFINLLDNAVKYSPDGKEITVDVSPLPKEKRLVVAVMDRGRGIPQQYRTAIFDKFRRLKDKDAPKGMGLGLAFCRMAVEAHGGRIWVDDAPGGGSRFNFTLPVEPF